MPVKIDPSLLSTVDQLPPEQQKEILDLLDSLDTAKKREAARQGFIDFTKYMWPAFIEGRHHKIMADAFERIAKGDLKRLIVNMPPRHTKSEFASYLLPAWFLGQYPDKKVIQTAHTAELSVGFGRKVRNLVDEDDFKKVFPKLALRADSKAAGRSLMTLIVSRKGRALTPLSLTRLMNGTHPALANVYNPEELLLS